MVPDPLIAEIGGSSPVCTLQLATLGFLPAPQKPISPFSRFTPHFLGQTAQFSRRACASLTLRSMSFTFITTQGIDDCPHPADQPDGNLDTSLDFHLDEKFSSWKRSRNRALECGASASSKGSVNPKVYTANALQMLVTRKKPDESGNYRIHHFVRL